MTGTKQAKLVFQSISNGTGALSDNGREVEWVIVARCAKNRDGLFVLNLYINRKIGFASRPVLERRILILPVAWALYGLLLVYGLQTLLGTIPQNVPFIPNDKPIGGSVLPVLFFNVATIVGMVLLTLYSTGYWTPNLSSNRAKIELGSVAGLLLSGFMLWYYPVFFFIAIAAVVLLMATNLE